MTNFTLSSMRRFSMPLSLFAKCKCENSHDSNGERGAHSMHRHRTGHARAPQPVDDQTLIRHVNVIVSGGLTKRSVGQSGGALVQRIGNLFVHGRSVWCSGAFFNSHFPSPDSFVYDCTVVVGNANKNVRGVHA